MRPLRTNTAPKKHVTNIGFGTHCHTTATKTLYPASPVHQLRQQHFQPDVTVCQVISDNTTTDIPLLAQNGCELYKLLSLLRNLTLKDDFLIALKTFYDEITLNLTASIKKLHHIIPDFYNIDPSKSLIHPLVTSVVELLHGKSCQTYIIMSRALVKPITNAIFRPNPHLI